MLARMFWRAVACVAVVVMADVAVWGQGENPFTRLECRIEPEYPTPCDSVWIHVSGELGDSSWVAPFLGNWRLMGNRINIFFVCVPRKYGPWPPATIPFELSRPLGPLPPGDYEINYCFRFDEAWPLLVEVVDSLRVVPLGDQDCDGAVDSRDVVQLVSYMFCGGPPPDPPERADLNYDGKANLVDVVRLVMFVYRGAAIPDPCPKRKGLRLYAADALEDRLFAVDPATHQLLDSLEECHIVYMVISPDGRFLYTSEHDPPDAFYSRKIATAPFEVMAKVPLLGGFQWVEQGSMLLQGWRRVSFIDPESFEVVRVDSVGLFEMAVADTVGFAIGIGEKERLTAYDFRNKRILAADSLFLPGGGFLHACELALHPSGTEGYGIFYDSWGQVWFVVFDTPSFRLRSAMRLVFPQGGIAPSPDGQYVLFTDPGDPGHGYPVQRFFVYDFTSRQIIRNIWLDTLSVCAYCLGGSDIVYSPDGARAFVFCGEGLGSSGRILVFDMVRLAFVDCIDIDGPLIWYMLSAMAVGREP